MRNLIALGALALALPTPAAAALLFDGGPTGFYNAQYGNTTSGQNSLVSFTLTEQATITGIAIWSSRSQQQVGSTATVRIRELTQFGFPSSTTRNSIATTLSSVTETNYNGTLMNIVQANFTGVTLNAGTYYIGLSTPNSGTPWNGFSSVKGGGQQFTTFGDGSASAPDPRSLAFRLYGDLASASAVPEPASWALTIVGFGMVGGALRTRLRRALAA